MKFYSTNNPNLKVTLREAVTQGLAPDNGLYMPEIIPELPKVFFDHIQEKSFSEIAFTVARNLIGDSLPDVELKKIIDHTIQFDAPLVEIEKNIFALELFHGPTLAFKDFGARFMSQLLGYFARQQERDIMILVATSGDTGSAVANGFLNVKGTKVVVLYPEGKVSEVQEKQFTTLGNNITAIEIDGSFDDCQRLVKQAFMDDELRSKFFLTSANSINIARLIPQSFYYFYAYAQIKKLGKPVVFSVPSGNFGNLTGGIFAKRMRLPVKKFVASTNINDVVPEYLQKSIFTPRPSRQTISNAMDVGNPSNFTRLLDLYQHDHQRIQEDVIGYAFTDTQTKDAIRHVYQTSDYLLDPHGAVGYLGLKKYLEHNQGSTGIFLETAHPGKFLEVVEETLQKKIELPGTLKKFLKQEKRSVRLGSDFRDFKNYIMDQNSFS